MSDAPKFPNNLRKFREAAKLSQPELAALAQTNVQNVSRIERGERELSKKWADLFAPHLGVSAERLMFGERSYEPFPESDPRWRPAPDLEGEAYSRETYRPKSVGGIPEIDIKLGAGEGAVGEIMTMELNGEAYSGHRIMGEWVFPESFLRDSGTNPMHSIISQIGGDSMIPNYLPGDRVVIDLSQNAMIEDGVYMFSDGDSPPQIKRLQRIPFSKPPRVAIISDNPAYRPFEVELGLVRIFGKIAWHVGRR